MLNLNRIKMVFRSTFILLAAPLLILCDAFAATRAFDCPASDKKRIDGSAVLAKVQKRYEGVTTLRAKFEQDSYYAATDSSVPSEGEVLFGKPGKMRWHYSPPEEQVFILNNTTFWAYQSEQNQVTIDEVDKVLISNLPTTWLMGVGNLSTDFNLKSACRSAEGIVLTLNPKSKPAKGSGGSLEKFALLVDESTNLPKGAQVFHVGGNVDALVLRNLSVNPANEPIGEESFSANFPKGADIIDNRNAAPSGK